MNLQRDRRGPLADVVIELDDPAELFSVDPRGLLEGSNRIDSGMDELVERLLAQKRTASDQRIVLQIAGECSDDLATNLVQSVRHYGELAVRRANRQHDLIWRQGMRSLISGSLLFATGIALSYLFTRPIVGEFASDLFGNGVFLVVAWVGLWYPLDVLFIAREQARAPIASAPGLPATAHRRSRPLRLRGTRVRLRGVPATGSPGAH